MKQKPIFRTFFVEDEGLNKILMKATEKTKVVYLKLKSEKRRRRIGYVTVSTKTFHIKRTRAEHLLFKANAYGFNEYVIKNQTSFDTVNLSDDIEHWKIPVSFIKEHGSHLWFKEQGFEVQLFLSLEQLAPYKIEPKYRL